jgi:hypothetical protein
MDQTQAEWEEQEAAYLAKAGERLEEEARSIEAENAELKKLLEAKASIVARLRQTLNEALAEKDKIDNKVNLILHNTR